MIFFISLQEKSERDKYIYNEREREKKKVRERERRGVGREKRARLLKKGKLCDS